MNPLQYLIILPLSLLLTSFLGAEAPSHEKLNEALGINFWNEEGSLWEESADDVAYRIGIRLESETSTSSSYRRYSLEGEPALGAAYFSMALYAENDELEEISLVFANKGDSSGDYAKQIQNDGKAIWDTLTQLLGEPSRERVDRDRILRWEYEDTSFILTVEANEYVGLRILPTTIWTSPEESQLSSTALKEIISQRVTKAPNGDVLIQDIPMVNQGPKGYCVPATFERVLRYYGIPMDMYRLALIGQSGAGGGTYLSVMKEHLSSEVRRKRRRWDTYRKRVDIREAKRWVDQGAPILWTLNVYPGINERVSHRSRDRGRVPDLVQWAKSSRPSRRDVEQEMRTQTGGAHLCMIIGYNELTKEFAVSDSWGPEYEVRWMFDTEVEAVSLGEIHVITP